MRAAWALVATVAIAALPGGADPQASLDLARAAIVRGDHDAARRHFEQAVREDDSLTTAHRWLSRLYAERGLLTQAIDAAAAAVLGDPSPADREHLQRLLRGGLPDSMAPRTPQALDLARTEAAISPAIDAARGDPVRLLALVEEHPRPAADPWLGRAFDRQARGYILEREGDRWQAALSVHFQAAAGDARRDLALHCAALLLRAMALQRAHLGGSGDLKSAPPEVRLWLTDDGEPGGESWGAHIHLAAVGVPREPAEWTRQVVHEYGHAALPGVNHFDQPEAWANGRLGEHLLARWLLASVEHGAPHPWLSEGSLGPLLLDADRCLRLFLERGPNSPLVDDPSAAGMDYYLGFANYVERALGPDLLADAMRLTRAPTSRSFALAVEEALAQRAAEGIVLRGLDPLGAARLPQWICLPAGRYLARCTGRAAVFFGRRRITAADTDLGAVAAGWHAISLPPGATVTFTLSREALGP